MNALAGECIDSNRSVRNATTTTSEVSELKKLLHGLAVSPLDKNDGRLIVCCPLTYKKVMDMTFDTTAHAHYEERVPVAYHKKVPQLTNDQILDSATCAPPTQQQDPQPVGTDQDILLVHWQLYYKRMGWDKIAPYNPKGSLGHMYALFKDKNCVPLDLRSENTHQSAPHILLSQTPHAQTPSPCRKGMDVYH